MRALRLEADSWKRRKLGAGGWKLEATSYQLGDRSLAYIICEPCIGPKDSAVRGRVSGGLHSPAKDEPEFEAAEMLYIHPDEASTAALRPACRSRRFFALARRPTSGSSSFPLNAEYFQK